MTEREAELYITMAALHGPSTLENSIGMGGGITIRFRKPILVIGGCIVPPFVDLISPHKAKPPSTIASTTE